MEITKNEIEKLFPSVYITLVSVLLGFAVEDVVNRLREIAQLEVLTFLAAGGILTGIIAGWIGWSFVSMTQERLPRVWDAVHVFLMAFCFYILISTLGMEVWCFFLALAVYSVFATVATAYNGIILSQSLTHGIVLGVFRWNVMLTVSNFVIYSVAAWMSKQEMLTSSTETFLIVYYGLTNITWIYFLYKGWSILIANLE